jgi:hypothetical protein
MDRGHAVFEYNGRHNLQAFVVTADVDNYRQTRGDRHQLLKESLDILFVIIALGHIAFGTDILRSPQGQATDSAAGRQTAHALVSILPSAAEDGVQDRNLPRITTPDDIYGSPISHVLIPYVIGWLVNRS